MKALTYLLIIQLKNRLLQLKKKPALLILYIFIAAMLVLSIIASFMMDREANEINFADERILLLILGGLGILFLGTYISTGLSTGSTLFSMPDVGLLFVAPISSKKILLYGLVSTLGKTILTSSFILFQVATLKSSFGYGTKELLALVFIYVLILVFGQLLSIATYMFSSVNSRRRSIINIALYICAALLLLAYLLIWRGGQIGWFEALLTMIDSRWFGFVPVGGWAIMFFSGLTSGAMLDMVISISLFALFSVIFILFLTSGKADYYEDVLQSTEIVYQKFIAAKEGKTVSKPNKRIKLRKEDKDILKGKGAITIAYKNILELKRKSRFIFIDGFTIFATAGVAIAGYNLRGKEGTSFGILAMLLYLQFFITTFGSLKFELAKPHIYLIPEKSIKKVFAASLSSMIKPIVDSLFIFTALGIVGQVDIMMCIFMALSYSACNILYVGITILYQRVLGGQPNMIAKAFVGIGLLLLVLGPPILATLLIGFILPKNLLFLATLPFIIGCLLFTLIIFLTCGNLLDKAEYTGK